MPQDSVVFTRDLLDDSFRRTFKPFLHQLPDGTIEQYNTEDEACDAQTAWRLRHGNACVECDE